MQQPELWWKMWDSRQQLGVATWPLRCINCLQCTLWAMSHPDSIMEISAWCVVLPWTCSMCHSLLASTVLKKTGSVIWCSWLTDVQIPVINTTVYSKQIYATVSHSNGRQSVTDESCMTSKSEALSSPLPRRWVINSRGVWLSSLYTVPQHYKKLLEWGHVMWTTYMCKLYMLIVASKLLNASQIDHPSGLAGQRTWRFVYHHPYTAHYQYFR